MAGSDLMDRRINIPRRRRYPYTPKPIAVNITAPPGSDAKEFGRMVIEAMRRYKEA